MLRFLGWDFVMLLGKQWKRYSFGIFCLVNFISACLWMHFTWEKLKLKFFEMMQLLRKKLCFSININVGKPHKKMISTIFPEGKEDVFCLLLFIVCVLILLILLYFWCDLIYFPVDFWVRHPFTWSTFSFLP